MRKKIAIDLLIGFAVTLVCNISGVYFISEFSDYGFFEFLKISRFNGSLSSVIALGALMDFLAFFVFLKKGEYYRVRGVLMGVILAALLVLIFKLQGS